MRTTSILLLTTLLCAAIAAGCGGEDEPQRAERGDPGVMMRHDDDDMHAQLASECPKDELAVTEKGKLRIATTDALGPPWFEGDPAAGEGFEGAVAVEVAKQLTFEPGEVEWVETSAEDVFEPGPKDWDFAIGQLAWSAERDETADFTRAYYEINQAVVALESSPVADADAISDLEDAALGAVGPGGEQALARLAAPNGSPATFDDLDDAAAALAAEQVDGVVVDLPTAFRLAGEVDGAEIVGQLPASDPLAYYGLVVAEGSPLVACLDLVVEHLGVMTDWLATEQAWWLSERATIPFFE